MIVEMLNIAIRALIVVLLAGFILFTAIVAIIVIREMIREAKEKHRHD